ncbi:unnamed protein product [Durusdinium trenchii]|uniref:CS domain-containing protein n=1 Tax=Durusdinium trenchii TaxID=1381693 RepID=A0ABP0ITB5_9DINO
MAIQPEFEQEDPCAVYTREHAAHTPRAISRESAQQKLVELDKWDAWEAFLEKTDPRKRVEKKFEKYTWSFGIDEDDEGFTRDCVILEVAATRETEPRHVQAKLTSKHLRLTLHGDLIIDDDFSDERWLSVEEGTLIGSWRPRPTSLEKGSKTSGLRETEVQNTLRRRSSNRKDRTAARTAMMTRLMPGSR